MFQEYKLCCCSLSFDYIKFRLERKLANFEKPITDLQSVQSSAYMGKFSVKSANYFSGTLIWMREVGRNLKQFASLCPHIYASCLLHFQLTHTKYLRYRDPKKLRNYQIYLTMSKKTKLIERFLFDVILLHQKFRLQFIAFEKNYYYYRVIQ